jgi:hypothetical protein
MQEHKAIVHIVSASRELTPTGRIKTLRNLSSVYVRVVSDKVMRLSELPPGSAALICNSDGVIEEQHVRQIAIDIERAGSTATLLVADAWTISSLRYKAALLSALRAEPSKVADLMDRVVKCWGEGQGRSYKDGGGSDDNHVGATAREAFDFTATAYLTFVKEPSHFGWSPGTPQHTAAVAAMRRPLQKAFEAETSGQWAEATDKGFVLEEDGTESNNMPTRRFNVLLRECSAALKVRQQRNRSGAHPLHISDSDARKKLFDLYREAVAASLPIIGGFINLAKASIPHVEEAIANVVERDATGNVASKFEVVQL